MSEKFITNMERRNRMAEVVRQYRQSSFVLVSYSLANKTITYTGNIHNKKGTTRKLTQHEVDYIEGKTATL